MNGINWSETAAFATSVGLVVAAISAAVGVVAYRAQLASAAAAHMHGLFRDFLRLCVETPDADVDDLNTLRLYTIEEVFDWTEGRRRNLRWWGWLQPLSLKRRREDIGAWRATALSYVQDKAELVARIESAPGCYGEHFLAFVRSAPE